MKILVGTLPGQMYEVSYKNGEVLTIQELFERIGKDYKEEEGDKLIGLKKSNKNSSRMYNILPFDLISLKIYSHVCILRKIHGD